MTTETTLDAKALTLPESVSGKYTLFAIGGLVLVVLAAILSLLPSVGLTWFFHAYLTSLMFCISISLGALFFVIIHHLSRAGWSTSVRRMAELLTMAFPALAVLFVPILATLWFDDGVLYGWDGGAAAVEMAEAGVLEAKEMYLSSRFFSFRAVLYFAIWCGVAAYFYRTSRAQDESGDPQLTARMQKWSGPATFLFALTTSFAAFDWMMSLAPMWFSTIFGVYLFASSMLAFFSAMCVFLWFVERRHLLRRVVSVEHWHDFGKYMFGFIVFWAYIAFSQYMLIWYGNIPEETVWFIDRQVNGWEWVSILLVLGHWLLPFLGLMSRYVRRRPSLMLGWAVYLLVMHFIDLYWIIMPQASHGVADGYGVFGGVLGVVVTLLCLAGTVGLYVGAVLRTAGDSTPLVPVRDPRLSESIAFHNV